MPNLDKQDLCITYRTPAELIPYRNNPRAHPERQLVQLEASIRAHGFVTAILIDEEDVVIGGHGRLLAAKRLGLASVPTIQLVGRSEAERRQLRIADNKIAQNAEWDLDLLKIELAGFASLDAKFDFDAIGFSTGEVDVLLRAGGAGDEDAVPLAPVVAVTEVGDIWLFEAHWVGCGDCRDHGFLKRLVGDRLVDAAFLDPPYNVKINGHVSKKGGRREFVMASGEMSAQAFVTFLCDTLGACAAISRDGAVHYVCMDHNHTPEVLNAGDQVYGARLNLCVWNKSNPGMGSLYRSKHELVWVFRVGEGPHFNAVELGRHGRNRTNVWDYPSVNALRGARRHDLALHPTVKPVALVADAIQDVTRRGDVVLDAFLGSGTTLIAAERTGRRFVGLDLDPAYVDLALTRFTNLTGIEPVLEATGEPFSEVAARRLKARGS